MCARLQAGKRVDAVASESGKQKQRTVVRCITDAGTMSDNDTVVLQGVFGIPGLREEQQAVVSALRRNRDCMVVMRTGGGKSVCFQLPCLTAEGCTVVVCPLQAISRDQVSKLTISGVAAAVYEKYDDINYADAYQEAKNCVTSAPANTCPQPMDAFYMPPDPTGHQDDVHVNDATDSDDGFNMELDMHYISKVTPCNTHKVND